MAGKHGPYYLSSKTQPHKLVVVEIFIVIEVMSDGSPDFLFKKDSLLLTPGSQTAKRVAL